MRSSASRRSGVPWSRPRTSPASTGTRALSARRGVDGRLDVPPPGVVGPEAPAGVGHDLLALAGVSVSVCRPNPTRSGWRSAALAVVDGPAEHLAMRRSPFTGPTPAGPGPRP